MKCVNMHAGNKNRLCVIILLVAILDLTSGRIYVCPNFTKFVTVQGQVGESVNISFCVRSRYKLIDDILIPKSDCEAKGCLAYSSLDITNITTSEYYEYHVLVQRNPIAQEAFGHYFEMILDDVERYYLIIGYKIVEQKASFASTPATSTTKCPRPKTSKCPSNLYSTWNERCLWVPDEEMDYYSAMKYCFSLGGLIDPHETVFIHMCFVDKMTESKRTNIWLMRCSLYGSKFCVSNITNNKETSVKPEDIYPVVCWIDNRKLQPPRITSFQAVINTTRSQDLLHITQDWLNEYSDLRVGDSLNFSCNASGQPPPTVVIHFTPKFASFGTLVQTCGLLGTVSCKASDIFGESVQTENIKIASKCPYRIETFDLRPSPADKGSKVTVTCRVEGYPKPFVKIIRVDTGQELKSSQSDNVQGIEDFTFDLENVTCDDIGTYMCQADLYDGNLLNKTVELQIYDCPYRIETFDLRPSPADKGSKVTVTCRVEGYPKPFVKIIRVDTGQELKSSQSDNVQGIEDFTFDLENVTCDDIGTYMCQADLYDGNLLNKTVELQIYDCPAQLCRNETAARDIIVSVNQNTTVSMCLRISNSYIIETLVFHEEQQYSCLPNKYQVDCKNTPISQIYDTVDIGLHNIQQSDHGQWVIQIKNNFGSMNATFNLQVKDADPNITTGTEAPVVFTASTSAISTFMTTTTTTSTAISTTIFPAPNFSKKCPTNWYLVNKKTCIWITNEEMKYGSAVLYCHRLKADLLDSEVAASNLAFIAGKLTENDKRRIWLQYCPGVTFCVLDVTTNTKYMSWSRHPAACFIPANVFKFPRIVRFRSVVNSTKSRNLLKNYWMNVFQDIRVGDFLNFSCKAKGWPSPKVIINSTPEFPSCGKTIDTCGFFGNFSCTATNVYNNSVRTETIQMVSKCPYRIDKFDLSPSRIHTGNKVIMMCRVEGYPKPFVGIIRVETGQELKSSQSDTLQGIEDFTFDLENVTCDDIGTYMCQADLYDGNLLNKTVELQIYKCPVQLCQNETATRDITLSVNQSTTLSVCLIWFYHSISTTVFHNGKQFSYLPDRSHVNYKYTQISLLYHTLDIGLNNIQESDHGQWVIQTKNNYGSVNVTINLQVNGSKTNEVNRNSGRGFNILCIIVPFIVVIASVIVGLVIYRKLGCVCYSPYNNVLSQSIYIWPVNSNSTSSTENGCINIIDSRKSIVSYTVMKEENQEEEID